MEITQEKSGDHWMLRLAGRLDSNWCGQVEKALSSAIRDGQHTIQVNMSQVSYMSSMGIRVLMNAFQQLRAIKGSFAIVEPSENIRSVLELAGLGILLTQATPQPVPITDTGKIVQSEFATYEFFPLNPTGSFKLKKIGDRASLESGVQSSDLEKFKFTPRHVALGVGALGSDVKDCAPRFGEFFALTGSAAYQPSDGSSRPDYVLTEGSLIPAGILMLGFVGEGDFQSLARFSPREGLRTAALSEIAATVLAEANSEAVLIAAVTETCGLVGASLRQSPAAPASDERFAFPEIREWLSFTSERAFRDSASLIVGVAAVPGTPLDRLLRPLGKNLVGHFHAAAFPYRPLQRGKIDLTETVSAFFERQNLQAVLHLLSDLREINGAGESEFYRGAIWYSPIEIL